MKSVARKAALQLVAIGLFATLAILAALPNPAWAAEAAAKPKLESWYNITPQAPPVAPPPVSPYPSETLHIGIEAGNENARTYLVLDLGDVPSGDEVTGGTLTLPVDPGDGTLQAETAQMKACFAPQPGSEVRGSFGPLPNVDCKTTSKAQFVATPTPRFLVDLTPFSALLKSGGIALMPADEAVTARATWHVAMYARTNTTAGSPKISATLFHEPLAAETGFEEDSSFELGPVVEESPPLAFFNPETPAPAPAQQPAGLISQIPAIVDEETGAYLGWVFLLPLILPLFVRYFGRALTLDDDLAEEDFPFRSSR